MSYMGFAPLMTAYCRDMTALLKAQNIERPVLILEIGVDTGQTTIPLMSNLVNEGIEFTWLGIDVRFDSTFCQQVMMMKGVDHIDVKGSLNRSKAIYKIQNSLEFLKKESDRWAFDLVLIDGDHNYDTVKEELSYLNDITHDLSLVVMDDYNGKHTGKDDWYSDKDSHMNLKDISNHLDKSENKGGVKRAVDEFLEDNPEWEISTIQFFEEPITLTKNLKWSIDSHEDMPRIEVSPEEDPKYMVTDDLISRCSFYVKSDTEG